MKIRQITISFITYFVLTGYIKKTTSRACVFIGFFAFAFVLAFIFNSEKAQAEVPVWVTHFDACTDFQKTHEAFLARLAAQKHSAERNDQIADIVKAREDVNKLVATVYNELRTQQVAFDPEDIGPDLRDVLHSLGIAVSDKNTDEICKAAYYIKADIGSEKDQCVAVLQESRFITNQDDYIYEEGIRRAMDALFCYLGPWRHFPNANINDPANCKQLGLGSLCSSAEIWDTLGEKVFNDENAYNDADGTKTPLIINDDQHVHNLCEGMRALGLKCAQDMLRDYVKYSTIDKITRKDRTVILAPPQTWYTPARCRIIEASLPVANEPFLNFGEKTPFTKNIKSLNAVDPDKLNSTEFINYYFGSKLGNPTIPKPPSNMDATEYTIEKELQAINIPENNFSGLAAKTEQIVNTIIEETTELRKLQYTAGEGIRDATLRIGWQDYEWEASGSSATPGEITPFLEKYEALDSPVIDRAKPNKIFKPLPCYWEKTPERCESLGPNTQPAAAPIGKTFYFDTGIVIAPIIITKSKVQSAIQAQFDLAQKALGNKDEEGKKIENKFGGGCGAATGPSLLKSTELPAPWEDKNIDLAEAINPLTGEPYTFGPPGKTNPSFRIPGISNNYFNFFYNDIFQLYHTPFPDVLAGWFRLETPKYDSIYGPSEPIVFSANGDPGAGPPDGGPPGGGGGGGGGGGTGSGECKPLESGPCTPDNLGNTCIGETDAFKASAICNVESGGNAFAASGSDKCKDGNPFSWGLFQINLTVHKIGGLDCPSAFSGKNFDCTVVNQSLYDQCVKAAQDANQNIEKACELRAGRGGGWQDWANTIKKCGFSASGDAHGSCRNNACFVVEGAGDNECKTQAECTGTGVSEGDNCSDTTELASQHGTSPSIQNDPDLDTLISCMRGRPEISGINLGSIFTTDVSRPLCNFTRADGHCSSCNHSRNSCHYGGTSGSTGALAVDFGLGSGTISASTFAKMEAAANACGATGSHVINEGDHVHVSLNKCDRN